MVASSYLATNQNLYENEDAVIYDSYFKDVNIPQTRYDQFDFQIKPLRSADNTDLFLEELESRAFDLSNFEAEEEILSIFRKTSPANESADNSINRTLLLERDLSQLVDGSFDTKDFSNELMLFETSMTEGFSHSPGSEFVESLPHKDDWKMEGLSNYIYTLPTPSDHISNKICDQIDISYLSTELSSSSPKLKSRSPLTDKGTNWTEMHFASSLKDEKVTKFIKGSKNKMRNQTEFVYDGIEIDQIIDDHFPLVNVARNPEPQELGYFLSSKLLELKFDQSICNIKRVRYLRNNLDIIKDSYPNVRYEKNHKFHVSRPYEPQYLRYEIDPTNGLPFNETRCGLCPYCFELNFKNLKTSTYSQHLALTHGIYTDNYLTPNPLYYGVYIIKKSNPNRKTKAHEHERNGVICPCCYCVVGTECSKKTAESKPLNNYLRHFKEKHRQSKDKSGPLKFFSETVFPNN